LTAFGNNIETLLIGRALGPFFGSVFLSNVAGSIADLFYKNELSLPLTVFSLGPFIGPGVGPVIGGFVDASIGFRWVFYIFLIWAGALAVAVVFTVPETYGPKLIVKKARRLRKKTGNQNIKAPLELSDKGIVATMLSNLKRPFMLFLLDPMMTLLCFYTGFVLAIVYFFFVAFPLVFQNIYNFKIQFVGLSFVGITVGMIMAASTASFWENMREKAIAANVGASEPEMRLPQLCVGGIIVPISLFMFAWTIYPSVHWIVPIIASTIFGMGCYWTFNSILSYTVEAYRQYAASAVAANVFVRCAMAGVFPLFGEQLINNLGYHWGITLFAFVSVLLAPSGFVFHRYGKALRARSRFAQ
jgi:hypothetical protein